MVRETQWVTEMYEAAHVVEQAADRAYDAVGTADEDSAYRAWMAEKSMFRTRERQRVGSSYVTDCGRCGGAGGSDAWRATGWTCFDCGGHGTDHRTYTAYRFRKDPRKRRAEDDARDAEYRAKDRAFAETVCELGDVGVALVTAAAATWEADRAVDAGYYGEDLMVDRETRFRSGLAWKLHQYGSLSEKQLAAVRRGLERDAAEAEKQARALAAGAFTGGKLDIEGTVVSTKWVESQYGSAKKMMVELDDGRRLWGTVARGLDEVTLDEEGRHVETTLLGQGDRVAFTATVEASQDDPTFGFFKRPTKARVVSRATEEE